VNPKKEPAMADSPTSDYRKEQEAEYGEFVALTQILYDGALAYNPGDPVPKTNVDAHGYLEQGVVARRTTKAAKAATEPASS
jgi:hypothetical protein